MADKAWIVKQGDAYRIDTNYMRCIYIARPGFVSTQRGGEATDPLVEARGYLVCLAKKGFEVTDYKG